MLAGTVPVRLRIDTMPRQVQAVLSRFDDELRQVIPAESRLIDPPPEGTFTLQDIAPGVYWLDIQADGYEVVDRPQVAVAGGQTCPEVAISMRKKN
jgi:hypothetical protein